MAVSVPASTPDQSKLTSWGSTLAIEAIERQTFVKFEAKRAAHWQVICRGLGRGLIPLIFQASETLVARRGIPIRFRSPVDMHHCVVTYWQNVVNGEPRIYSILESGNRTATPELTSRLANYEGVHAVSIRCASLLGHATRAQHPMCPRQLAPLSRRSTTFRQILHQADARKVGVTTADQFAMSHPTPAEEEAEFYRRLASRCMD